MITRMLARAAVNRPVTLIVPGGRPVAAQAARPSHAAVKVNRRGFGTAADHARVDRHLMLGTAGGCLSTPAAPSLEGRLRANDRHPRLVIAGRR
jgi:hypothetical protein